MSRQMKTVDGNNAAAHVSYPFTDVAAIYPITPSSVMAEVTDIWSEAGKKNLFGDQVRVVELQSEAGAAGTVHGSLAAGALTTTYTASQGLLLMIPNMYKIAGELLPGVLNVSARAIASHALSIFGDHSDIYACRQTGFAMLCSTNPQEIMDLGAVVHGSTIESSIPFLHFFDGFRTSHEIQKIEVWDDEDLKELINMDAVDAFRKRALNPDRPVLRGSAQNPDVFFQAREASNNHYIAVPGIVEDYMEKVNKKIGTDYKLFNFYGAPDAESVIIAMGSVCDTIDETIDYLVAKGEKVGVIKVRLYRPFSVQHLLNVIPDTVKQINVLDRTKEPGAIGEPLYLDVATALKDTKFKDIPVFSGRYGLGSKDTTPGQIVATFNNTEKKIFTIGIEDDVTFLSLPYEDVNTSPSGTISCKFWGLGSDGTVGANKNSIKIIGDHTDLYAQAYFDYDSKKSGGVTMSHLRFGEKPIQSTYLIKDADFVACHNPAYVRIYDMVQEIKPGGTFLLNASWNMEEIEEHLPGQVKRYMAENDIKFYTIDGYAIGREIGLGGRINTILQAAFFKLAKVIPVDDAVQYMKDAATASYGSKGEAIVNMNHAAIDRGITDAIEIKVPAEWKNAGDEDLGLKASGDNKSLVNFVNNVQGPVSRQKGDSLPVSAFMDSIDGTLPQGSAAYEKRGIAIDVPSWIPENCIQCNFCSYVCPHAVIRPIGLDEEQSKNKPEGFITLPMNGIKEHEFAMVVSVLDCTGCGSCVNVCPGKKGVKALEMTPIDEMVDKQYRADFAFDLDIPEAVSERFKETTVKGSQFKKPLLEFSGACGGCGETPYAKLVTQLFGDRMYIANATGCTSIWGGSMPSTPYTTNKKGQGPAWANSLFEDNAEFGYGMLLAQEVLRDRLKENIEEIAATTDKEEIKKAAARYMETYENGRENSGATSALLRALESCDSDLAKEVLHNSEFVSKKSQWIFGGDGWAYDIGFGGLDHVLASGQDVNVLVFDTEIYSNTGGQSSKSTPTGAIAQFAAAGKEVKKKDLAQIAMTYGYVYVAQISQGADYNQTMKALIEAESYNGPSLIIAYSPCISHGIRGGMGTAQTVEKNAVTSGYWNNFRFDPRLVGEGKNPFQLDSKAPTTSYQDFLKNEVRFSSLSRKDPERANELFAKAESDAKKKFKHLQKLVTLYEVDEDEE